MTRARGGKRGASPPTWACMVALRAFEVASATWSTRCLQSRVARVRDARTLASAWSTAPGRPAAGDWRIPNQSAAAPPLQARRMRGLPASSTWRARRAESKPPSMRRYTSAPSVKRTWSASRAGRPRSGRYRKGASGFDRCSPAARAPRFSLSFWSSQQSTDTSPGNRSPRNSPTLAQRCRMTRRRCSSAWTAPAAPPMGLVMTPIFARGVARDTSW
mmetsp:Transcript_31015/g.90127  ORF Transcript_31015/g.90127 Transcript_31015/m.90127 type:complete len:217 (-) Transcript_31015:1337-1987(-)